MSIIKTLDDNHPWYNLRLDLDTNVVLNEYQPQMIRRPNIQSEDINYTEFDIDIAKNAKNAKNAIKIRNNRCSRDNCVIS